MWRRDCYKSHYKSLFGSLAGEVYSYTDAHYVPHQQLKHTEISLQRLIPQQQAKKTKKTPKKVKLLQNGNILCSKVLVLMFPFTLWCLSCCQRLEPVDMDIQGRFHSQVLLLSGEGVGEALHRLRFVLCYFGLDGLRYFLNHRINLFQEAVGLVDLIHLSGQRGKN